MNAVSVTSYLPSRSNRILRVGMNIHICFYFRRRTPS